MRNHIHDGTDQGETWLRKNGVALVGFALNLIVLGMFIGRQTTLLEAIEKRTNMVEISVDDHVGNLNIHTNSEWRNNILSTVNRIEGKIDAHIMTDTDARIK